MRKTQSYQQPCAHSFQPRMIDVSSSHELPGSYRMSLSENLFAAQFKNLQNSQSSHEARPLLERKGNNPSQKAGVTNPKFIQGIERLISNDQNFPTFKALLQKPQFSARLLQSHNTNINEQPPLSYRQSHGFLRKSEHLNNPDQGQAMSITQHINRVERESKEDVTPYSLQFGYRTNKGFSSNSDKVNQDICIINLNLEKSQQTHFFGICDGHGPYGHHVSGFLKNHLNEVNKTFNSKEKAKEKIFNFMKTASEKLVTQSKIDLAYSGSTLVGCYICKDRIYCCNVGDSRAIIGSKGPRGKTWSVWQLSTDHKPSLKSQAERILKNEGRIDAVKDKDGNPLGPLRVWLKNQQSPGLAMTRSFGDLIAAQVGVSWQPDIVEHFLSDEDRIILIASDGVWEFLQNEDIVKKLSAYYEKNQVQEACSFLLDYSKSQWTKETSDMMDDISFILVFLYHK